MQAIAAENNLAETAFTVKRGDDYELRWFTPVVEVDLCGHATLATAWVVFEKLEPGRGPITFHSRSGPLVVRKDGERLALDFPADEGAPCDPPPGLVEGLGIAPLETFRGRDVMAVLATEDQVRGVKPDFARLASVETRGVIVTAPGKDADFVSRFFAPRVGIDEDPVTGSAHCTLVPYWARRLRKTKLRALQISPRGGELWCELAGSRVILAGRGVPYLEGTIEV
jgi:predicted PhzF superfamily epimerase YddE/YHI9